MRQIFGNRTSWQKFFAGTLTAGALALAANPALAAAPATTLIDGALTSSGGSAAADGDYDIAFSIYDASSGGTAAWTETAKVKVAGGRFSHALGSVKALNAGALAGLSAQWLALKVGSDPELPRQQIHAAMFALAAGEASKLSCAGCVSGDQLANGGIAAGKVGFNYAGADTKGGPANDVACTNCVNVGDMKFDGDVDLAGNSIKGKNGTFSGTVAAAEFVGDGSKLTGLKTPAGECKNAGEVVKGINADGSLKCVAALDPTALPKDGLNEISNELLSNQFVDTIQGAANVAIPDNTGSEGISNLNFDDIGTSQTFEVTVEVSNTDLSVVSMVVLPPDDKKTGWTLCDPCGNKDDKVFKVTYSKDKLPKSGDLAKWIGANPKGLWTLKVLDTGYCLPQAPGNSGICDPNAKTDGKIVAWSIKIQTLSNKKIAINGDTYQGGKAYLKDVDVAGNIGVTGSLTVNGVKHTSFGKSATYRWAYFNTYMEADEGWMHGDSGFYFGGVAPSNWTNGNYTAQNLSADKDVLRTLFVNKGYANGPNALLQSQVYYMYSSTNGPVYLSLWRIKNSTDKDITWPVAWTYTAYTGWGENASIALNGSNVWNSPCNSQSVCNATVNISIPKNRTSTVIFQSTGSHPYSWGYNIQIRKNFQGFYNNCLKLPAGLEFVDDFDTATGNWAQ